MATSPQASAQLDPFAAIAASRPSEQAGLVEPQPPPRPERVLPVAALAPASAQFRPLDKVRDEAGLKKELAALRKQMAPFMRDLAPKLPETRIVQSLDRFQWRQETESDRQDFAQTLAGGGDWETVSVPHYGGPLGRAVTYYRTSFELSDAMLAKGALFIHFNGVDYKAHVFVNGAFLGSHEGFFAPFEFEFTGHARPGANTLLVKVENDAICMGNDSWGGEGKDLEGDKIYAATGPGYDDPAVGWHHCPPGMGIYQTVRVEARAPLFIHDLFVRPLLAENRAEAWVELWNCDVHRQAAKLTLSVFGQNFEAVAVPGRDCELPGLLGPRVNYYRFNLEMPDHRLWELDTPWLYQLQARLSSPEGELLDAASLQFGMRSFTMDVDSEPRGRMYFNNREIRLRGANTMGFEQQAVMKGDFPRLVDDILLAKLCNMNYLRFTQRPVQPEIYDHCDRLGLMTQSDLPLFAKMRRNQFAEGARQAGEMERLVRSHPCNIMVTYTNEPFQTYAIQMWRHLSRPELESFFVACDQSVLLENPDRVIKAVDGDYDPPGPGLPDNHCYCCWYNGHGVELGKLHRGFWQPIKPGWMHGCGEFGAEGLDFADLMRRRYPAAWLPATAEEEATWSPNRIVRAQSGQFHYIWFDTQRNLEDWVRASHAHQAWGTSFMTEAMRRDSRLNSCAIHLFIDAFPSGWMKTIMDVERRPKPAFFAYREALSPLLANLRTDRHAYYAGETAEVEAWLCNDTCVQPEGARLAYRLELDGKTLAGGSVPVEAPRCSSACQGLLRLPLPEVAVRTKVTVRLALLNAVGTVLNDTSLELKLFPRLGALAKAPKLTVLGDKAAALALDLGVAATVWVAGASRPDVVLVDDFAAFQAAEKELRKQVKAGTTVVLLEIPAGEFALLAGKIECKDCGMGPVQFVSRDTGHEMAAGFEPDDFKFWYDVSVGRFSPLLERAFTAEGWTSILKTGNGGWGKEWSPALAAAEKPEGKGVWRVCNVKLSGRVQGNPAAELFARRLVC